MFNQITQHYPQPSRFEFYFPSPRPIATTPLALALVRALGLALALTLARVLLLLTLNLNHPTDQWEPLTVLYATIARMLSAMLSPPALVLACARNSAMWYCRAPSLRCFDVGDAGRSALCVLTRALATSSSGAPAVISCKHHDFYKRWRSRQSRRCMWRLRRRLLR